ncbi:MAG: ABC transporter ATP-binding protein [Deltaproteobacteria bacterium]|nr:ABC transporter ATP-binding protein [Deltaproteobacteria bacterium]
MTDNLVTVRALCKRYPDILALDNLSFHLKRGEILGLLGPNGAGKTTAIHVLLGLLTPTTGEVSVFGLSPLKDRHRIAKRLNFSSAYVNLPANLKVHEVMTVFSKLYLVPEASKKIASLLDLFEISHLKNRVTGALSAGEKTRLNLCKCLLNDPELLLLDEPSASLDPEMADTVRSVIKKIQKEQGIGVVYTSHNMMEVEELCDRILFIHQGKKIAEGPAEEVKRTFKSGSLQEVFIKIVRNGDLIL